MTEQRPCWSNGQRCESCGAWCIDDCVRCGAPQCCPQCCLIDTERVAREAAEARAKGTEAANEYLHSRIEKLEAEVERVRELAAGRQDLLVAYRTGDHRRAEEALDRIQDAEALARKANAPSVSVKLKAKLKEWAGKGGKA